MNTESNTLRGDTPAAESVTRILAVAEELFAARGFDAVSMNAIAEAAAVSKANVFHHFGSKKDLYLAVVRAACRQTVERLGNLESRDGPIAERLAAYSAGMLSDMLQQKPVQRLILRELLKDDPQLGQELAENVFGDSFARLVAILRAGQHAGELRADADPAMVATLLIGANVFFFQSRQVLRHFRDVRFAGEPARYSHMLVDILLRGILAQSAPSEPGPRR